MALRSVHFLNSKEEVSPFVIYHLTLPPNPSVTERSMRYGILSMEKERYGEN
jgi:hypothetical protein